MKKVVLTILGAFAVALTIYSCEPDNDQTQEDILAIDNEELKEDDI
jgi:hypothetical protein